MVETYEMPWRPNFELAAAAGWGTSAALCLTIGAASGLPLSPFLWMAALGGGMGVRRAHQAWRHHQRKSRLAGKRLKFASIKELQAHMKDGAIWLGNGFEWDQPHTQLCYEILKRDKSKILPKVEQMGAPWIHGVSMSEEDLQLPINDTKGHLLVVGTTGSGKTRLFDLLVTQAILRGESVIIIDPKGDRELRENAQRACAALGKPEKFVWFHPGFPEKSARIDPMKNFSRATELASRIANLLPGEGPADPFKSYAQMALNNVVQGLVLTGRQPNLVNIRSHLEGGLDDLVIRSVSIWCEKQVEMWEDEAKPFLTNAKGKDGKALALIRYYREKVHHRAPNTDLEGLLSMFEHDRTHFGKMIASLLPLLGQLTSGHMGGLLSPNRNNDFDERAIVDMASVINLGQVCYIGLDSLTDAMVGSAIGSILLADLASVAGDRYNYGVNNTPVNIFVDEAAEVVNDPLIQILNKGRGAELRLLIATQTFADFVTRLGSEPKARQVLGNVNNLISLRVTDNETQTYITDGLPTVRVKYVMTTQGSSIGTGGHETMQFGGNAGERLMEEEAELFTPALLGQLPNLEFVAKVSGGRLLKGRLPILKE